MSEDQAHRGEEGDDDDDAKSVVIELRVPGPWATPAELVEALEKAETGYSIQQESEDQPRRFVHDASGWSCELGTTAHDDDIAEVFAGSEHPPTAKEMIEITRHAVKVHLVGEGGTIESARGMMQAATALIHAGGAGVFMDCSGASHGRTDWLALAGDTDSGGLYWAYVVLAGGENEIYSIGMHALGFRDAEMPGPHHDPQHAGFLMHNFLGYVYQSGMTVHDGDMLGDDQASPEFRALHVPCTRFLPGTSFYNPFGIYRLEKHEA